MKRNAFILSSLVGALALMPGCKDDPPPPPAAPAGAKKDKTSQKTTPEGRGPQAKVPRISQEMMKRFRVETCYFGSYALRVARDAYMKDMKDAEPGPDKIPSFGDYPDPVRKKREEAVAKQNAAKKEASAKDAPAKDGAGKEGTAKDGAGKEATGKDAPKAVAKTDPDKSGLRKPPRNPLMGGANQLPFVRHVRGCQIARSLKKPAYEGLDKAIDDYAAYATELNKALVDANRYYASKRYEKDEFKRAQIIDKKLKELFPKLDEKLAALATAVNKWNAEVGDPPDALDEAGKLSRTAVKDARALTLMLVADERDPAKVKEAIAKLEAHHEKLGGMADGDKKQKPPHARVVPMRLEQMIEAAKAVGDDKGKLTPEKLYPITAAMAGLIEADQRGLAQLLRDKGMMKGGSSMRLLRPRMKHPAALPVDRAKPSVRVKKGQE